MLSRSTPTGALIALAAFFVLTIASPSVAVGKEVKSAKGSEFEISDYPKTLEVLRKSLDRKRYQRFAPGVERSSRGSEARP